MSKESKTEPLDLHAQDKVTISQGGSKNFVRVDGDIADFYDTGRRLRARLRALNFTEKSLDRKHAEPSEGLTLDQVELVLDFASAVRESGASIRHVVELLEKPLLAEGQRSTKDSSTSSDSGDFDDGDKGSSIEAPNFRGRTGDAELLKALLAEQIIATLEDRKMSVSSAVSATGISAADFSRIRKAKVDRFTIDRLIRILNGLDRRVEVSLVISPSRTIGSCLKDRVGAPRIR